MLILIEPDDATKGCGIMQIDSTLYILSWCCGANLRNYDYACDACGKEMKPGLNECGRWVTSLQLPGRDETPQDYRKWVAAWTGLDHETLSVDVVWD